MKLTADAIVLPKQRWWEMAGHDNARLTSAWINTHHAAQAAAELGKSWSTALDDDSHSNFFWIDGDNLLDGMLVGQEAASESGIRAAFRVWDLHLFVIDAEGRPLAQLDMQGKTAGEAQSWVRGIASEHAGNPLQAAAPAPDLPAHDVQNGGAFEEPNQLAQAELIRIYGNTSRLLDTINELAEGAIQPRIWPHHFDFAGLVTARQDAGRATRTIGLGVTPPDALSDTGYWYVSPWSAHELGDRRWPDLELGRWIDRGGSPPMALLPIDAVTSTEDPVEQAQRLASFVASAFNTCWENLSDA